jgi:single-strand DNA-binding protein
MASFNKVIIMGNLTRDPQVRYTPNQTAVTDLGLAVNRTWYDKGSQQKREEVTFVDVTLWGRQAEVAGEYLSKGRSVLIEGRLHLDSWDDKETGQKRSKLTVVCENMTMVGGRNEQGGGGYSGGSQGGGARSGGSQGGYAGGNQSNQSEVNQGQGGGGGEDNQTESTGAFQDSSPPDDEVPF